MPTFGQKVMGACRRGEDRPATSLAQVLSPSMTIVLVSVGFLALTWLVWPHSGTANGMPPNQDPSTASAEQEMQRGKARFQQGSFAQAAVHWMAAARLYEERVQPKEQCQALINLAHALQQEGQIRRAQGTLQTALKLSEQTGNRLLTATILGQLGNTAHVMGKEDIATEHLTKALTLAREENRSELVAGLLNDLGNSLSARRQFAEAIDVYAESRSLAVETNQLPLAMTAQVNGATALLQNQQVGDAQRQFDQAWQTAQSLPDSRAKAAGMLNVALGYQDLQAALATSRQGTTKRQDVGKARTTEGQPSAGTGGPLLRRSVEVLTAAGNVAARIGDARGQSYAWGYLGELLEKEHRPAEALEYSRKASFAAQQVNAPESLYRWQWQTARLLKAEGKEDEALDAYQRAVTLLKPIRYEYSVGPQGGRHSFDNSVAPLFVEYEDVLLRRASSSKTPEQSEQWLVRVKDTVENSYAAELQDYFQDDCVATARSQRRDGTLPPHTAVVYPISLPDRLELMVETVDGLKQVGVPVKADRLTKEIRTFRQLIQDPKSQNYLPSAQTLYGWLVAPLQPVLQAAGITTLVVVPDGALRTIPIGALHDGKQFVVDKFAVAVTPGMELVDFTPAQRRKGTLLSVGLTESVEGVAAPLYAESEVQAVRTLYGGKLLMNKQFSAPILEQEIKDQGVGIVHVASHTVIGNDAKESFVLAHDGKISMDRLSQLVGLQQYRQQPLDLLTLSACETPEDDDRAGLGLMGVAVKTGARTALASLWVSENESTSELISEFYRQLQDPTVTKAMALQRAQQKILAQRGRSHPSYWASFLLINNWM